MIDKSVRIRIARELVKIATVLMNDDRYYNFDEDDVRKALEGLRFDGFTAFNSFSHGNAAMHSNESMKFMASLDNGNSSCSGSIDLSCDFSNGEGSYAVGAWINNGEGFILNKSKRSMKSLDEAVRTLNSWKGDIESAAKSCK